MKCEAKNFSLLGSKINPNTAIETNQKKKASSINEQLKLAFRITKLIIKKIEPIAAIWVMSRISAINTAQFTVSLENLKAFCETEDGSACELAKKKLSLCFV